MKRIPLMLIIGTLSFLPGLGQELVTGLQVNTKIKNHRLKGSMLKSATAPDTLQIPFFDDFSFSDIDPSPLLWTDNDAFVNNTYPLNQVTQGVVSLDALDNSGKIYPHASTFVFEADHLTSCPIDLELDPSDNIYLSFFYQPGGISDPPDQNDSLTLQFYSPISDSWTSVWQTPGTAVQNFKPVIIRIDEPEYLVKGFKFRFTNYASLSSSSADPAMAGNVDLWNIDYILLDKNRTADDTIHADVAFTKPLRSLLNNYESMPWSQFRQVFLSEMGSYIQIHYVNNDEIQRNVTRTFIIDDVYGVITAHSFSAGATNINPGENITYNADLLYTYNPPAQDSALFRVKAILITDDFDPKENDTIIYYQDFKNYFARDDGTAEAGYGINGQGANNAMVAVRFRSYIPDSLRAVNICFNDSYQSANQRSFDLVVWEDDNGIPGNIIYTQEEEMVDPGIEVNGFISYTLDEPLALIGYFFVGWKQRSETFLNAGLDMNTTHNGTQLYYLNGNWNVSQVDGSLMVRPVVGKDLLTTSIKDDLDYNTDILIWPNPVSDILNIDLAHVPRDKKLEISVYDMRGRRMMSLNRAQNIDVSSLPQGIYYLIISSGGREFGTSKFIRIR